MPELPEVETIRRDLESVSPGREILGVTTDTPKMVQPSPAVFTKLVVGQKILKVARRAKIIQLRLTGEVSILAHLKLTGRLLFRSSAEPADEWQHIVLELSGGCQLRFCDLRKFGWLKGVPTNLVEKEFAGYGPEPLGGLTLAYLVSVLASTRRPVKVLLLDQQKIGGVGNIYANDALFLAKIHPARPASSLTNEEAKRLLAAVEQVIQAGLDYRGASDNHYLDAFGRKGAYQDHFLVYAHQGKPCVSCGQKIVRTVVGGRGTFVCPHCQPEKAA